MSYVLLVYMLRINLNTDDRINPHMVCLTFGVSKIIDFNWTILSSIVSSCCVSGFWVFLSPWMVLAL